MTNEEKIAQSAIPYSGQATALICNLKDGFNFEDFEEWVQSKFVVGGGYVLEFLETHEKNPRRPAFIETPTP